MESSLWTSYCAALSTRPTVIWGQNAGRLPAVTAHPQEHGGEQYPDGCTGSSRLTEFLNKLIKTLGNFSLTIMKQPDPQEAPSKAWPASLLPSILPPQSPPGPALLGCSLQACCILHRLTGYIICLFIVHLSTLE